MNYTILSIGPIYETMKKADNTRAIWTVSFLFSYLMRETIKVLQENENINDQDFVVPAMNDAFREYLTDGKRAGLFHDRLLLKGKYATEMNKAYESAVSKLCDIIVETFKASENKKYIHKKVDPNLVKEHFQSYFQSYIATVDIEVNENPVLALSAYVDAVEYEPRLALHEEYDFLHDFLRLTNLGALQEVAFLEKSKFITADRCFKSLPEISAWELIEEQKETWKKEHLCLKISDSSELKSRIKDPQDEISEIIKLLEKEFRPSEDKEKKTFKPYHKYVSVVQADGDGFGKYLESIGNDEKKLAVFSANIFKFASKATKIIESFGGSVIMAGGDDLLFFAPVVTDKINIFTLIQEIDTEFHSIFKEVKGLSMSYGVSISYYKFPLQEALTMAANSLWAHAKQSTWVNTKEYAEKEIEEFDDEKIKSLPAKNAIHINIRKHSGQSHSLTLPKDTELYKSFLILLQNELDPNINLHLPHALHYALMKSNMILNEIDTVSLKRFFKNQFDEDVHKTKHKEALEAVISMLGNLKDENESQHLLKRNDEEKINFIEGPTELVYSMLSTIKMLRGDS